MPGSSPAYGNAATVLRLREQYGGIVAKIQRKGAQMSRYTPQFNLNGNFKPAPEWYQVLDNEVRQLGDRAAEIEQRIRALGGSL